MRSLTLHEYLEMQIFRFKCNREFLYRCNSLVLFNLGGLKMCETSKHFLSHTYKTSKVKWRTDMCNVIDRTEMENQLNKQEVRGRKL